ncbi:hypothetical protein SCOCK_10161 [Actinacidiphila cocklensis]|uniref:Uncharacterized protein n=1 Tax=Actinacidiphila cocklensis TaxID=887465 RepID=A0A9W4DZV9_9ACTN|nr:hypothetical protein SCOCK_10161 [Actinacidiphila cocklensis]
MGRDVRPRERPAEGRAGYERGILTCMARPRAESNVFSPWHMARCIRSSVAALGRAMFLG